MPRLVAAAATVPSDVEGVRTAFRLGRALSGLGGRYRPERFHEPVPVEAGHLDFGLSVHELPLSFERSPDELRIETLKAGQDSPVCWAAMRPYPMRSSVSAKPHATSTRTDEGQWDPCLGRWGG